MRGAFLCSAAIALASFGQCAAADFPEPPADVAAAETAGLRKLSAAELKSAFAGSREERSSRGEVYRAEYRPDGGVELRAGGTLVDRGSFSVTGQSGGSVCLMLEKQMNQRLCTIWFAAPDDSHLFGYNPTDGKLRVVSRALHR